MKLAKAPPVVSDINVTPMVDVMLVLLIIFMVITPMLSKGQTVNMVKTHNPIKMQEADKEDAVLIAVTRDGKVFLSPGNTLVQPSELPSKVKDLQTARSDKTVYLKADARARFSSCHGCDRQFKVGPSGSARSPHRRNQRGEEEHRSLEFLRKVF